MIFSNQIGKPPHLFIYLFIYLFRRLPALAIAMLLTSTIAYSQSSTFTCPVNEANNVELIPTIKLLTDCKISESSITGYYYCPDSTEYNFGNPQSILLLPKFVVDSIPDTLWKYLSARGSYSLLDSNLLAFTPNGELYPGLEYVAKVVNLKVVNLLNDTISLTENSITFTTVPPAHKVISKNFFHNGVINCADTLSLTYNRKLFSVTTTAGDLLKLYKIDSIKVVNDTLTKFTTQLPLNTWIDSQDSTKLKGMHVLPLTPGEKYLVKINTQFLTGDELDYEENTISIREYAMLVMDVATDDTTLSIPYTSVFPDTGFTYICYGDSLCVFADREVDSLIFLRWECPGEEEIDSLQRNYFTISTNCENLHNYFVKAVYGKKKDIVLNITADENLTISVYSSTFGYLGGSGTYTISPDDFVYVVSDTGSNGTVFSHWESSEQRLNQEEPQWLQMAQKGEKLQVSSNMDATRIVPVHNLGRDIGLSGTGFEPEIKYFGFNFITFIEFFGTGIDSRWEDENNLAFKTGYLEIYIDDIKQTTTEYTTGTQPVSKNITFAISESAPSCFTNQGFYISGVVSSTPYTVYDVPPNSRTFTIQLTSTSAYETVWVEIMPTDLTTYDLTVEAGWEDGESHLGTGEIGKDVTVFAEVLIADEIVYKRRIELNENSFVISDIFCNATVRLTPEPVHRGFHFENWKDDEPLLYDYPTPSNSDPWEITMDEDKTVKALFEEGFRLEAVGFHMDCDVTNDIFNGDIIWFDYELLANNDNILTIDNIEIYNYKDNIEDGYGTNVYFRFNQTISLLDFYNKIEVIEKTHRLDNNPNVKGNGIYYLNSNNSEINPNFQGGNVVTFYLENTEDNYSIMKGLEFDIEIYPTINSLNNSVELETTGTLKHFQSELPGIQLYIESITAYPEWYDDLTDPPLEILVPYAIRHLTIDWDNFEVLEFENANQYPSKTSWKRISRDNFPYRINQKIYECSQMLSTDNIHALIGVIDEDYLGADDWSHNVDVAIDALVDEEFNVRNEFFKVLTGYYHFLNFELMLVLNMFAAAALIAGAYLIGGIILLIQILSYVWQADIYSMKYFIYNWNNLSNKKEPETARFLKNNGNNTMKVFFKKNELLNNNDFY